MLGLRLGLGWGMLGYSQSHKKKLWCQGGIIEQWVCHAMNEVLITRFNVRHCWVTIQLHSDSFKTLFWSYWTLGTQAISINQAFLLLMNKPAMQQSGTTEVTTDNFPVDNDDARPGCLALVGCLTAHQQLRSLGVQVISPLWEFALGEFAPELFRPQLNSIQIDFAPGDLAPRVISPHCQKHVWIHPRYSPPIYHPSSVVGLNITFDTEHLAIATRLVGLPALHVYCGQITGSNLWHSLISRCPVFISTVCRWSIMLLVFSLSLRSTALSPLLALCNHSH